METPVDGGDGEIDVMPMVEPIAIFLIVIGVVLFVVAFLGCFGACCNSRLLLALVSLRYLPLFLDIKMHFSKFFLKNTKSASAYCLWMSCDNIIALSFVVIFRSYYRL